MRNLNEQISRIKTLMLIKEQCGGDLSQCEEDLEAANYKVFSPIEQSSQCESNDVIKCVKDWLTDNSITNYTINSVGDSINDCYVLVKGNNKIDGNTRFHFSFYADNQVVLSMKLDNSKNGGKKLLYRGRFDCGGSGPSIMGGKGFKYIGVKSSSGADFKNEPYLDPSSGVEFNPNANKQSSWGVKDPIKYDDTLSFWLNGMSVLSNVKVLQGGLNSSNILKIINY